MATKPRSPSGVDSRPLRLCLAGAPGDTGNLGVGALHHAALSTIARLRPDTAITVFDSGWGIRKATLSIGGSPFEYTLSGMRLSRRLHRRESIWNVRLSAKAGGLSNPTARALRAADGVLDVSGGDSFSDLYGRRRFRAITMPKLLALDRRIPLILLPQTYGPFSTPATEQVARRIVQGASMAWARDPASYEKLVELAGEAFDPERHLQGVDMAFALEAQPPHGRLPPPLGSWVATNRTFPLAGLNVSGLIFNDAESAKRYGFRLDYHQLVRTLIRQLLRERDVRVMLVPHVSGGATHEDDARACQQLLGELPQDVQSRVAIAPGRLSPNEAKWLISRVDWFCGTRMHSTIAALSSGVPTAALAYSLKTKGVFQTCQQEDSVADSRYMTEDEALATILQSWERRSLTQARLPALIAEVQQQATLQMASILTGCEARSNASGRRSVGNSLPWRGGEN